MKYLNSGITANRKHTTSKSHNFPVDIPQPLPESAFLDMISYSIVRTVLYSCKENIRS